MDIGRLPAVDENSGMQDRIASLLLDKALVTEPTLRKITLALGTKSREDSIALVRADPRAARVAAKIIDANPPGQEGSIPAIASTRPAAPAKSKGPARLKIS